MSVCYVAFVLGVRRIRSPLITETQERTAADHKNQPRSGSSPEAPRTITDERSNMASDIEIEFTFPNLVDEPPGLPESASRWEKQEARRLWRNALMEYADTMLRVHSSLSRVAKGNFEAHPMCNDAQDLAQAIAAEQALSAHMNGIHHRAAMLRNQAISTEDLAQLIRSADGNHSLGAGALAEKLLENVTVGKRP